MDLVEESFKRLFPDKEFQYVSNIKYSRRFKDYNANIRRHNNQITLGLSKSWRFVSKEIQIGLIQSLLLKVFKNKKNTTNMDLYNIFIRKLHISVPKTKSHPILEESFNRVNEKYFFGLIEIPNLCWGTHSIRKLGSYEYQTDTITISKIFVDSEIDLLDYVMYHELLHKKHKFKYKNGRTYHHTKVFKQDEEQFEDNDKVESKIKLLASKHTKRSNSYLFNIIKRNFSPF